MSDSPATPSGSFKWVRLTAGILIILAAIGGLVYTSPTAWTLWKLAHTPGKGGAAHISVDTVGIVAAKIMGELIALFIGVRVLQPAAKEKEMALEVPATQTRAMVSKPIRRKGGKRWQSCNVLQIGSQTRHLWNFAAGKNSFNLNSQLTVPTADSLPVNLVGRDWKILFQPKLNIAWLPVEKVFLRVTQLPLGDFAETLAMVEMQLEKLSPMPVTQIVWSVQILPEQVDNLQTVIVIMMERDLVEKFLGDLEGQGFLADRLELPILDQLQATVIAADGAFIYPDRTTGKLSALVAWWTGGVLRNLGLLHVPAVEKRDSILKEQLMQMAWAGELEGWLHSAPRWHLVADEATAANWQPMFQSWLGQSIEVLSPVDDARLATMNANRAARSDPKAGILPPEYATRYQQEFVDRLWMRGLGVVLGIYILGVIVYMAGASIQGYRTETVTTEMAGLSRNFTNALRLKAQLEILQNRQALKFASLDCWKITAELLPESLTVQTLEFKDGKHYSLSGVAPADQGGTITDFNEALRKSTLNGQPLFELLVQGPVKLNPGGSTLSWSFSGDLARAEEVR